MVRRAQERDTRLTRSYLRLVVDVGRASAGLCYDVISTIQRESARVATPDCQDDEIGGCTQII
jgi:hypothetical protein